MPAEMQTPIAVLRAESRAKMAIGMEDRREYTASGQRKTQRNEVKVVTKKARNMAWEAVMMVWR